MKLSIYKKITSWDGGFSKSLEIGIIVDEVKDMESTYNENVKLINDKIDAEFGTGSATKAVTVVAHEAGEPQPTPKVAEPEPKAESKPVELATPAQKKFLDGLGVAYTDATTKQEASALISKGKGEPAKTPAPTPAPAETPKSENKGSALASKAQRKFLTDLGIKFGDNITKAEASALIEKHV